MGVRYSNRAVLFFREIFARVSKNNPRVRFFFNRLNLIRRIFLSPYVSFVYIPYRSIIRNLNSEQEGFRYLKFTDTGILILFYSNHIVKIPLGPVPLLDLRRSFQKYKKLKATRQSEYVNYWLEDGDVLFKMELLEEGECKQKLVEKYFSSRITNRLSTIKSEDAVFKKVLIGRQKFISTTKIYLPFDESKNYSVGLMHGDLTPGNIMTNSGGESLLIDLNRFEFEGFPFIDEIHFDVELHSKRLRISYFEFLVSTFATLVQKYQRDCIVIYVLYRVGAEHNDGVKSELWYYDGMKTLADTIVKYDKGRISSANERQTNK